MFVNGRFGSLALVQDSSILMSAFGGGADVRASRKLPKTGSANGQKRTWTMHEEPPNAPALAPVDQEFLEGYP